MSIFKTIFHAIGSAASAVGKFFANAFNWVETDGAKIAVAVVEELKTLLDSGTVDFLAQVIDALTKSNIPTDIVNEIKSQLPTILADAMAVQNLGTNPTDDQVQAFSQQILASFGVTPDKSQLYSTVGAKIIGIIRANTAPGQTFTFATLVNDLEQAYQAYVDAKNQDSAA